ncbi:MAG: PelD GGDEF domain-containing protein [Pseudomonadales bacterium]|nr:PelD GGDEF domain-containing protein [Pseudomonadales bacterium]
MLEKIGKGKLFALFAPEARASWAIIESIALTLLAVAFGLFLTDSDPLAVTGQFRWFLMVPILVALRYGSLAGGFAMLCLLASWFALRAMGFYEGVAFPEALMLGGLILTLVCGEFADMWRVRLMRADSAASYALERLQNLTQRYVLLRLSHDRLEENLLVKPYTVRDALARLRDLTLDESDNRTLPAADDLINLLAEYCQLQRAAIYPVANDQVQDKAVALLGETKPLEQDNALMAHALENNMLAHIQQHEYDEHYHGLYLVAAPIANSTGEVIGMLVVERLPFLSMNEENLQLLSVLLNFYADVAYNGEAVDALLDTWPQMPFRMASELVALARLHGDAHVETALTVFVADESEQAGQILDALARGMRSLDLAWWINDRTLMIMMPMTGESSLEGFVLRTEKWLQEDYAFMSLRQAGVQFFYRFLGEHPPQDQVKTLLEVSGV